MAEIILEDVVTKRVEKDHPFTDVNYIQTWHMARNLRVLSASGTVGAVQPSPFPDEVESDTFIAVNCTPQAQVWNKQVTITVKEGLTVTVNNSYKLTKNQTAGIKLSIKVFDLTGSAGQTVDINSSTTEVQDFKVDNVVNETINREVPPHTALSIRAERKVSAAFTPFSGKIVVDGDIIRKVKLYIHFFDGEEMYGTVAKLSDWYPDEADRTFEVHGEVWNAVARELVVHYDDKELDPSDPKDCPELFLPNNPLLRKKP